MAATPTTIYINPRQRKRLFDRARKRKTSFSEELRSAVDLYLELPPGFDASELLIHVKERGVLFAPGRYFYVQSPLPNTLRLAFSSLDEKQVARGVATLAEMLKVEMRKRQRGVRRAERSRVALV